MKLITTLTLVLIIGISCAFATDVTPKRISKKQYTQMGKLRIIKFALNKFTFLWLAFCFLISPKLKASQDVNSTSSPSIDVIYDYELITDKNGKLDCTGNLIVSVNASPENFSRILFGRSIRNNRVPFGLKSSYEITEPVTIIEKQDVTWDTDFKMLFYRHDGTYVTSPIYNVKDYIAEETLNTLLNQSTVTQTTAEPIKIFVRNRNLYVNSEIPISLSIFDLKGHKILDKEVLNSTSISLEQINTQYII
ncbi:MAG: hypothetical protein K2M14_04805, partial [Muribaculaceae bacterium]|nr:hypothetical protein [Muribaculaceae bacterium]